MARILFIDDMPLRANGLFKAGHEVFLAHGPEMVKIYLDQLTLDLVCLDHDMPLGDGMQIAHTFLIERNIPVMVHSANTSAAARLGALLTEYGVPNMVYSILHDDFEKVVDNFLSQKSPVETC